MAEQQLANLVQEIETNIKSALVQHHMTQVELARLLDISPVRANQAIKGDMRPSSVAIRKKIYRVLDIKD
ncbi:helix-turn-helix domain-containing protein [Loigolactobacillus rennini]|uniref:helix-turn-helix domain-containing protein n=1 Tax=Loigolactobacillus rennini TaxID=238013 RepID=UPI0007097297|nr:helix-turn-helix transcriptional regulator [Loigolactobacillus rennini]